MIKFAYCPARGGKIKRATSIVALALLILKYCGKIVAGTPKM